MKKETHVAHGRHSLHDNNKLSSTETEQRAEGRRHSDALHPGYSIVKFISWPQSVASEPAVTGCLRCVLRHSQTGELGSKS